MHRTITGIIVTGVLLLSACASDAANERDADADTTRSTSTTTERTAPGDDGPTDDDATDDDLDNGEPPEDEQEPAPSVTVATINLLHGLHLGDDCPPETEACGARDRLAILWDHLEEAGCPHLVGLQEIGPVALEAIPETLADLCDGVYEVATDWVGLPVEVAVLSRLPVTDTRAVRLSGISWGAQWVRVDSAVGPVELFSAHFASSAEPFECEADSDYCAPRCEPGTTPGDCHPLEALDLFDRIGDPDAVAVLTGDLNRPPDDPRITTLIDADFVDLWTVAGGPECDPDTGEGCTCCLVGDGPLGGLDTPAGGFRSRIDFVLARQPQRCELDATVAPLGREPLAEPSAGLYWASDHAGVVATLECR